MSRLVIGAFLLTAAATLLGCAHERPNTSPPPEVAPPQVSAPALRGVTEGAEIAYNDNVVACLRSLPRCNRALLNPPDVSRIYPVDGSRNETIPASSPAGTSNSEDSSNPTACLNGYPGCDRTALAEADVPRVAEAAYRRNVAACLNGYPGCDRTALAEADVPRVAEAAYRRNVAACLNGYPGCDRTALAEADVPRVAEAAYRRNVTACLNGYPGCDRTALAEADVPSVAEAEARRSSALAAYATPSVPPTTGLPGYGCAENGSCYGDTSALTGRPKTVHVQGYYRRDGTYVRGHYRSRPRR